MRRTPAIVNLARILSLFVGASAVPGCAKKKPSAKKSPSPSPSASPLALSGSVGGPSKVTLYKKGAKWLELTMAFGEVTPRADRSATVALRGQKAVAFENGKPTLELSGDLIADTRNQTVVVQNGATVRLLAPKSPATIFSDTIRWNRLSKTLAGENNVRFETTGARLTGRSFTADDALTKMNIKQ